MKNQRINESAKVDCSQESSIWLLHYGYNRDDPKKEFHDHAMRDKRRGAITENARIAARFAETVFGKRSGLVRKDRQNCYLVDANGQVAFEYQYVPAEKVIKQREFEAFLSLVRRWTVLNYESNPILFTDKGRKGLYCMDLRTSKFDEFPSTSAIKIVDSTAITKTAQASPLKPQHCSVVPKRVNDRIHLSTGAQKKIDAHTGAIGSIILSPNGEWVGPATGSHGFEFGIAQS